MSSVIVIASDLPLEEVLFPAEEPVVHISRSPGYTAAIRFDEDFAVWPIDGYLEIPSEKKYFAELALYNPACGEKAAEYLRRQLQSVPEIELWHVWLDGDLDHRVRTAEIGADELTAEDIHELEALEVWREPVIYYRYIIKAKR